jgi:hypothetical protein
MCERRRRSPFAPKAVPTNGYSRFAINLFRNYTIRLFQSVLSLTFAPA